MATPFIEQDWVAEHAKDARVRLVDCRFDLNDRGAGWRAYLDGHLPGAAFMDVESDLSGAQGEDNLGRHPLPTATDFGNAARRAGISADSLVVAYDQEMAGGASRLWWLLQHFGHARAAILRGGIAGWTGSLSVGEEIARAGDFTPTESRRAPIDAKEVGRRRRDALLLDARAPERYRGEVEPIDPVAGHIPGARNVPFTGPLPTDVLTHPGPLLAYCGSGVTATVLLARLAEAGRDDAELYAGSWSDWVARGLPVAVGADPEGDWR